MGIEVNFEGKVALVTGASSGLGARFAKVLAMAGAQVILAARRVDRLKESVSYTHLTLPTTPYV